MLFCGINPSLYSAATGWHFARPGNRLARPAAIRVHPGPVAPAEQHLLPGYGLGITNLVARATAQAAELDDAELQAGACRLTAVIQRHRPRILAIAGATAYRTAFGQPRAVAGAAAAGQRPAGVGAAQPERPERALEDRRDRRRLRRCPRRGRGRSRSFFRKSTGIPIMPWVTRPRCPLRAPTCSPQVRAPRPAGANNFPARFPPARRRYPPTSALADQTVPGPPGWRPGSSGRRGACAAG